MRKTFPVLFLATGAIALSALACGGKLTDAETRGDDWDSDADTTGSGGSAGTTGGTGGSGGSDSTGTTTGTGGATTGTGGSVTGTGGATTGTGGGTTGGGGTGAAGGGSGTGGAGTGGSGTGGSGGSGDAMCPTRAPNSGSNCDLPSGTVCGIGTQTCTCAPRSSNSSTLVWTCTTNRDAGRG